MSNFKDVIPSTWVSAKLADIYMICGGGTPSTKESKYWGGNIPWITSADIDETHRISPRKYVTAEGVENSTTTKVPRDTLIVVSRVGLGKLAIANEEICFSQDLQGLVMSPYLVLPAFVKYLMSYELQYLKFQGQGTTISGLTKNHLKI